MEREIGSRVEEERRQLNCASKTKREREREIDYSRMTNRSQDGRRSWLSWLSFLTLLNGCMGLSECVSLCVSRVCVLFLSKSGFRRLIYECFQPPRHASCAAVLVSCAICLGLTVVFLVSLLSSLFFLHCNLF